MKKRTTLKDIAEKVGIASTSVSKALRDSHDISPEMIKKVKKVAREMGYRPNLAAQNLVNRKSFTIGVLLPEILTSHHSHVVNGFYKSARARGYEAILMISNEDVNNELHCLRYFASLPVDGIVATVTEETTDYSVFEEINESGIPVVLFGRAVENTNLLFIGSDDFLCASKVMESFIRKGHKKIAYIGPQQPLLSSRKKFKAYSQALKKAEFPLIPEMIKSCKINDSDGYLKTKELLEQGNIPDAILCANDMVAIGAVKALKEKGFEIPKEVAVAGFGNLVEASVLGVPISTIDFKPEEMGQIVMNHAIELIENNSGVNGIRNIFIDAELIEK